MIAHKHNRTISLIVLLSMLLLLFISSGPTLRAQDDLPANSSDRFTSKASGTIVAAAPKMGNNDLTAVYNGEGKLVYPKFEVPTVDAPVKAADNPAPCGLQAPQYDMSKYRDLTVADQVQNAQATVCDNGDGTFDLVGYGNTTWPGRTYDPFVPINSQAVMTATTVVLNTYDNTVVFERTEVMVVTPDRNGNPPDYTAHWRIPTALAEALEVQNGTPGYKIKFWFTVRQNGCGNGSGVAYAEASWRVPQNTPTPTLTNTSVPATFTPTYTPVIPTATNTATPLPTATDKPTMTPTPTVSVPTTGTLEVVKVGIINTISGTMFIYAPGWPFTITTTTGQVVAVSATEGNGRKRIVLPVGRYLITEASLPDWHPAVSDHSFVDIVGGQVSNLTFKNVENKPLSTATQFIYLPFICRPGGETVETVCPLIHFVSKGRAEDSGISPGYGPDNALTFIIRGHYKQVWWKVWQLETDEILTEGLKTCDNDVCITKPIYGTQSHPKPCPNCVLVVTAQVYDMNGKPLFVCSLTTWSDDPVNVQAASSAQLLQKFLDVVKRIHEMDKANAK